MIRILYVLVLAVATVATALSAPPEVPLVIDAPKGEVTELKLKIAKGTEIGYSITGGPALFTEVISPNPDYRVFWLVNKSGGQLWVTWWTKGETAYSITEINKGVAPPPPKPVDPVVPDPVVPPVDPLKTFRVFIIFESGDTITPQQNGILTGGVVENWCLANCTGGKAGFRRRDKSISGEGDPSMNEFWKAVQPQITVTPCIAMERNGKIVIDNLSATPAAQVEALSKYRGK